MSSRMQQILLHVYKQLIFSNASESAAVTTRRLRSRHMLTSDLILFSRFEMDYILATLKKPYVAVLDGFTSTSVLFI